MINLDIPYVCLLHHLPNEFSVTQADQKNDISISLQGHVIYTTSLYAHNGVCTFHDLRTLIHDNMRQRALVIAKLEISVAMEGGCDVFEDHFIVFSDTFTPYEDDDEFFNKCFLTTRTYYTVPRSRGAMSLSFLMVPGQSVTVFYDCVFRRNDGSTYSARLQHDTYTAPPDDPMVIQHYMPLSSLDLLAKSSLGSDYGTLLAFSVNVGARSVTIFLSDDQPIDIFYFNNIFNVSEIAFIYGTKTVKTEFSAKEARCGGRSLQYDLSRDQKFQIETRALSIEEAEYLTQMFEADNVTVITSYYEIEHVVFSDVSSEISNSPKDHVRLKFSYRYQSNMLWMKMRN